MLNIKTLLILAIVAIITIACATRRSKGSPTSAMPTFSNVDVDGFQTFIAAPDVQLLDVRTPDEYADGHIAGAVLVDVNESDFEEKAVAYLEKGETALIAIGAAHIVGDDGLAARLRRAGYEVKEIGRPFDVAAPGGDEENERGR